MLAQATMLRCFNTQPPEGGWVQSGEGLKFTPLVSTHSRLKAAGDADQINLDVTLVSTHSRLKAAGLLHQI